MRSRTNGALWGIWGSPQQAKIGQFSRWRKSLDLPKGYQKASLAGTMSLTLKGRGKTALLRGSYPSYNEGVIGLTGHCLSFYARTGKL